MCFILAACNPRRRLVAKHAGSVSETRATGRCKAREERHVKASETSGLTSLRVQDVACCSSRADLHESKARDPSNEEARSSHQQHTQQWHARVTGKGAWHQRLIFKQVRARGFVRWGDAQQQRRLADCGSASQADNGRARSTHTCIRSHATPTLDGETWELIRSIPTRQVSATQPHTL